MNLLHLAVFVVVVALALGVGFWLLLRGANVPASRPDLPHTPPLTIRARMLTNEMEQRFGAGYGEAKRHQVYARLIKEFPYVPKRAISRAIEDALERES